MAGYPKSVSAKYEERPIFLPHHSVFVIYRRLVDLNLSFFIPAPYRNNLEEK